MARWLAAPPEEEEEIGFLAEGGDQTKPAENTFKKSVPREAPMAKVLKVSDELDEELTTVRRRLPTRATQEDCSRLRSC